MRLVLASADTHLRLALQLILSEELNVEIVGTASESRGVLALIDSASPDVVLLDWGLPGVPTQELLCEIKKLDGFKVIVLSSDPSTERDAMAAGAHAFVIKGEPPEKLLESFWRVV